MCLIVMIATLPEAEVARADTAAPAVVESSKVDHDTYTGFITWKTAGCGRCHGANQEGIVGPSLIESLKTLSKADFIKTVMEGRVPKGMPSFTGNASVAANIDKLYVYLKARSEGRITTAAVEELSQ
ncbi:MAG: hypothetical protein NVS9B10_24110 [Nevskia sp.]